MTLEGALLLKNLPDPAPTILRDVIETSSVEPELEKWSWSSGIVIFIDGLKSLGDTSVNELEEVLISSRVTSSVLCELK